MGQAKQRGTYEERKSMAIKRDNKIREEQAKIARRRPSPKYSKSSIQLAAIAASCGVSVMIDRKKL